MEMFVKSGHYVNDYEPIMWGAEKMVLADDAKAWAEVLERAVADSDEKALAEASKPGVPIVSDWMKSEEDFQFVHRPILQVALHHARVQVAGAAGGDLPHREAEAFAIAGNVGGRQMAGGQQLVNGVN